MGRRQIMKNKKILSLGMAMLATISSVSFTACEMGTDGNGHVHQWSKFYIAKDATCTEDGILEAICSCGEKSYQTLLSVGHKYKNNVCSVCGNEEKEEDGNENENAIKRARQYFFALRPDPFLYLYVYDA